MISRMNRRKSGWGGPRVNSGRKSIDPKGKTVRVTVTLPHATFNALSAFAKKRGSNVADTLRTLIAGALS
jgi:hypothetical protein